MIKLGQLAHRNLETKVQFDIEQPDGTFKKEPFRIVTRDMPQAEFQALLDEVKTEAEAAFAGWEKRKSDYHKAASEAFEQAASDETVENFQFDMIPSTAAFSEPPPPTEQHLFHSRIVARLPDLVDDDGTTPEPTVETFERLGQNANLVINEAIWRRRTEIDQKK